MKKLLLLALVLAGCSPKDANAKNIPNGITVLAVAAPGDSLKYILRWTSTTDAFGPVDGYSVGVTSTRGFTFNHTTTATVDSFSTAKPAFGDSVVFTAKVQATRRGVLGPQATTSWKYKRKDQPPPAPGPIVVDSTQIIGVFVRPEVVNIASGDTVHVCSFVLMADSTIRIGVDPRDLNPGLAINYCSGAPLTQFKSERST